jgi:predicted DNA binding CopG/RHH family protein
MKKKIIYTDAPPDVENAMEHAIRIPDFLPSPEELASEEKGTSKVTISLSKKSLSLFKKYAHQHNAKYQAMIRRLVDSYAEKQLANKRP